MLLYCIGCRSSLSISKRAESLPRPLGMTCTHVEQDLKHATVHRDLGLVTSSSTDFMHGLSAYASVSPLFSQGVSDFATNRASCTYTFINSLSFSNTTVINIERKKHLQN